MKVAFITSTFPSADKPSLGIFNLRSAKALNEYCDLTVYKLRIWKPGRKMRSEIIYEGIKVKNIALPLLPYGNISNYILSAYISYFALRKEIKKQQYDLLFSSGFNYGGLLCALIAPYAKTKHVAQAIGSDVNFDLPKLKKLGLHTLYYKGVNGVISVCMDIQNTLRGILPLITNSEVVYRGIDIEKFKPETRQRNDHNTQFLFLGGFPQGIGDDGANLKGGITLTQVWKENEDQFNKLNFKLVIGGIYSNSKWLKDWKARLRFAENVEIVGTLKSEQAKQMIIESDIVLIPSLGEGLPNLAVESSALERVVLGSSVNGIPEIVINKKTGIILSPRDMKAWRDAMIEYGSDKEKLREMGKNAREWVCKQFDSKNFAPHVMQFFHKTLSIDLPVKTGYKMNTSSVLNEQKEI